MKLSERQNVFGWRGAPNKEASANESKLRTHRHPPYDARYIDLAVVNLCQQLVIDFFDSCRQRLAVALPRFDHAPY